MCFKKTINGKTQKKEFQHSIRDREFYLKCSSDTANNEKQTMQRDIIAKKIQMKDFSGFSVILKNIRAVKNFKDFFFFEEVKPYSLSSCKSKVKNLFEILITIIIILKEEYVIVGLFRNVPEMDMNQAINMQTSMKTL